MAKPSTGEPLSLPESKETLTMQLKQLADGKRSAVFVAEGSPKVLVPRGMNTIPTHEGRIHFNPKFISADHVHKAIANGRLSDLLGYVQNKNEALNTSLRSGGMPKFVVSRDADGVEQDAAAVSPDRVHEQAQIFAHRAKPGSRIGVEDSSKTIASRESAFNGGRKKYQDGGVVKDALDLAWRNKNLPQMSDTVLDVPRKAAEMFPFINQHRPNTKISIRPDENWAETFPPGEKGDPRKPPDQRRPKEFPIKETGVEIYRPDFSPADYAAEFLHVDPKANRARDLLTKSLRPDQKDYIKQEGDYNESIRQHQTPKRALQNQIDGMLRGYVMQDQGYLPNQPVRPATDVFEKQHQQPKSVIEDMNYSPEQKNILEDLKRYTTQRAVGGPVMHDDIMNALRLANQRQGYADGGAPAMMGSPKIGLPMGAPAMEHLVGRTFSNYGQPADQATINNIVGRIRNGDFSIDQFNDWANTQYGSPQGGAGQIPPGGNVPPPPPAVMPGQINSQIMQTLSNYGQPYDQATVNNIAGRIGSGDFTVDQFNDWARSQYNNQPINPPNFGEGITPFPGQPITEYDRGLKPGPNQPGRPIDPTVYPGGSPIFPYGDQYNAGQNEPVFMPPRPNVFYPGEGSGIVQNQPTPVPMQPPPQPFNPGGPGTMGQGPSFNPQSTSGLKSDADFQRDLQSQLSNLGGYNQSALAMTNPFLGNNPMQQGTGYVYNGDGGLDKRYGGPGSSQTVPDPGSVALPASAPPSTPTNPGGMSMGSGLKNGPSQNFGGGGGFSSGLKNGPGRNYGSTPTSGSGFGG